MISLDLRPVESHLDSFPHLACCHLHVRVATHPREGWRRILQMYAKVWQLWPKIANIADEKSGMILDFLPLRSTVTESLLFGI